MCSNLYDDGQLIDPLIEQHGGRIANTAGDSLLLEFPSAVDAVRCSIAVQEGMAERNGDVEPENQICIRVGINVGDVVAQGDDLLGDGVNIAARLESLCEAGGLILSDDAYRQVRDRIEIEWEDGGEHEVKNIARPVQVWRWGAAIEMKTKSVGEAPLALPDKPSIAVLPFENMSGDPEQEYFADGIAEDVITALSRFRSLFVIARNSTFTYKGRAVDIKQVGRELGVRYVVEGSVRKAGNRVRITAQLIEATSGNHLWADRFDGNLDDIFDLQDQITEQIVVAVEPEIAARERDRVRRKPPGNLAAWELVHRGLSHYYRINKTDNDAATRLFHEAIALDPEFAAAHAFLADALWLTIPFGFAEDTAKNPALARAAAEKAVSLDPNEPEARYALGQVCLFAGEVEMAIGEMQTTIAINPNDAQGHHGLGWAYHFGAGQAEQSLPHYDAALRLSPRDPMRWRTLMLKGSALRFLGHHEEAISTCRQACQFPDAGFVPHMHLAAALGDAGQIGEAKMSVKKAMQFEPALSLSFIRSHFTGMHEIVWESLSNSLRKAGVPEE